MDRGLRIDIGIATWNRAAALRRTLADLAHLTLPQGATLRVLVCDNNSSDTTPQTVEQADLPFEVCYLFCPTQGKSHALNMLREHTEADWMLLIDDDITVAPGWLGGYMRGIRAYPNAGVLGGPIAPSVEFETDDTARFLLEHYPGVFGVLEIEADTPMARPEPTAYGGNMAVRADLLKDHPFDPRRGMLGDLRVAGEDVGYIVDLLEAGHSGWLLPDAAVHHRLTPADMTLDRFRQWNRAIGRQWLFHREPATPGKFGVPWWAWREAAKRWLRAWRDRRDRPSRPSLDRLAAACQWMGYLEASARARRDREA